jgi:hypothetical protein
MVVDAADFPNSSVGVNVLNSISYMDLRAGTPVLSLMRLFAVVTVAASKIISMKALK